MLLFISSKSRASLPSSPNILSRQECNAPFSPNMRSNSPFNPSLPSSLLKILSSSTHKLSNSLLTKSTFSVTITSLRAIVPTFKAFLMNTGRSTSSWSEITSNTSLSLMQRFLIRTVSAFLSTIICVLGFSINSDFAKRLISP